MVDREARSSVGCLSDASGAASQSVAGQEARKPNQGCKLWYSELTGMTILAPNLRSKPLLAGIKWGLGLQGTRPRPYLNRVQIEFSTVFLQEHFYVFCN